MAGWLRNVSSRSTAVVGLALVIAAFAFAGSGIYSVLNRDETDQAICGAVQGLRDDMVRSFRKIKTRAIDNAKTQKEKDLVEEVYEKDLIAGINDPQCP